MTGALTLPDLTATWEWLASANDPAANLVLFREGIEPEWSKGHETDRRRLLEDAALLAAFVKQHPDGSWGPSDAEEARILPTLWVVKALVDAGLDREVDEIEAALQFLEANSLTKAGYFSTSGNDEGVLACYVGLAVRVFHDAGRIDLAVPQLEWLTTFQQLKVHGEERRHAKNWGHDLDSRYGGCFASTSCLVGVARATEAWSRGADDAHVEAFGAGSEVLLERGLAFTREGELLPLKAGSALADEWARPSFPSDWRIDLVDMIHATAGDEPRGDERAQRAIDLLMSFRRADGAWSRGWHVTSPFLRGFGAPAKGEGSPMATGRAVVALTRWGAS